VIEALSVPAGCVTGHAESRRGRERGGSGVSGRFRGAISPMASWFDDNEAIETTA